MKSIFIYISRSIAYLISYLIPVDKHLLLFVSNPDFADNSYAIFIHLIRDKRYDAYKYYWLVSDDVRHYKKVVNDVYTAYSDNKCPIHCFKRKSVAGIWFAFRARYILCTCGLFYFLNFRGNKRINMWHGMPIKKIYTGDCFANGDYTISTSKLFIDLMSEGLNIDKKNVLLIGQPRNDFLLTPEKLNLNFTKSSYSIIGIWMPTFKRTNKSNGGYIDGKFNDASISFISFSLFNDLNDYLKSLNALLILKIHPLDVLQNHFFTTYSNILVLKNDNFEGRKLYSLLSMCDFLLTDYSSVAVDYEMLNRPIGFVLNDMDEYANTRGLFVKELPGKIIPSYDELKKFIHLIANKGYNVPSYGDKYNKYRDSGASLRLINFLNL